MVWPNWKNRRKRGIDNMGKFILCTGKLAEEPLYFPLTKSEVYSIEELCYYLYENIYTVTEDTFDRAMVVWLREQLEMKETAEKLEQMIKNRNGMKDIVVTLLCSADYYTEDEIKDVIQIIDSVNDLPLWGRMKIKGDNYLRYEKYTEAAKEYEKILHSKEAAELDVKEYGDILHNLAIAHVHTRTFHSAAQEFKEAYSRNNNEESLKQYFFALKLGKYEKEFEEELLRYQVSEGQAKLYLEELNTILEEAKNLQIYKEIKKFSKLKEDGKVAEYYENIETLIGQWKKEYREEL